MPPLAPKLTRHLACRHTSHTDRELITCIASTLGVTRQLLIAFMLALALSDAEYEALAATPSTLTTGRDIATTSALPTPISPAASTPVRRCRRSDCWRPIPGTDGRQKFCDKECRRMHRNRQARMNRRGTHP